VEAKQSQERQEREATDGLVLSVSDAHRDRIVKQSVLHNESCPFVDFKLLVDVTDEQFIVPIL
jgi:hypothetical protein